MKCPYVLFKCLGLVFFCFVFLKEINWPTLFKQGYITLIKSHSKYTYNVTKDFYLK